jgi:hypothetical protein
MKLSLTKTLAFGAALFGGLLAGVTANRALVELPAWERVGAIPWANFTRAENHGVGSFFYLVVGFLALLLTVAAAIAFRFDPAARSSRRFPAYAAALLAITYAVITRAILVPAAFRLRAAGNDGAELQRIFVGVVRWSGVNDILHVVAFSLSLWAFAEILARRTSS